MNSIFAQCTAPGKAGVTVFRISGPESYKALEKLILQTIKTLEPRKVYFRRIYNPETKNLIDDALIVYFPNGASFTGEESVEIHTHGSLAVIKQMNHCLSSMSELRLAEPGEFAKRSFLNGKMDLTAAEGLADLIDAETELQHKQAIRQLGGGLQKIYEHWRQELITLISKLEAYIDFPDEDIPIEVLEQSTNKISHLIEQMKSHLDDNNRGERLRNGLKLAIVGKPNVGKSSLLNYFMKRDMAIVSDIAGTTRDVLEGHVDLSGYPIILQDTAGIRQNTDNIIEQHGINKAKQVCTNSDIKIILYDATSIDQEDNYFYELIDDNTICVLNKIDLENQKSANLSLPKNILPISVKNDMGLKKLIEQIVNIAETIASPSDTPQITRERHRALIKKSISYLMNFDINNDLVLVTEDIRIAMRSLSTITGQVTVDEILGEIFSNFCIGK